MEAVLGCLCGIFVGLTNIMVFSDKANCKSKT